MVPPADAQQLSAVPQKLQYAQWYRLHSVHIIPKILLFANVFSVAHLFMQGYNNFGGK